MNMNNDKIYRLYKKIVNKETISYGIAGIMTTIINFLSYEGLFRLGIPNLTANAVAWVIAVTFAYVVNKIEVFSSKSKTVKDEAVKVTKFYGARLVTLGIEQLGMYIFIDRLGYFRLLVKAIISIFVIILNYIFSKLYIFNKKKEEEK
jgi:putative flippase GtrA